MLFAGSWIEFIIIVTWEGRISGVQNIQINIYSNIQGMWPLTLLTTESVK